MSASSKRTRESEIQHDTASASDSTSLSAKSGDRLAEFYARKRRGGLVRRSDSSNAPESKHKHDSSASCLPASAPKASRSSGLPTTTQTLSRIGSVLKPTAKITDKSAVTSKVKRPTRQWQRSSQRSHESRYSGRSRVGASLNLCTSSAGFVQPQYTPSFRRSATGGRMAAEKELEEMRVQLAVRSQELADLKKEAAYNCEAMEHVKSELSTLQTTHFSLRREHDFVKNSLDDKSTLLEAVSEYCECIGVDLLSDETVICDTLESGRQIDDEVAIVSERLALSRRQLRQCAAQRKEAVSRIQRHIESLKDECWFKREQLKYR